MHVAEVCFFFPIKKIETVAGEGIQFALEAKRDVCFSSAPEGSAARPFFGGEEPIID